MGFLQYYQKNKKITPKWSYYGHVTYLNSYSPYDISGMAKARDFKFCTVVRQVAV